MSGGGWAVVPGEAAMLLDVLARASWEGGLALALVGAIGRLLLRLAPRVRCALWRLACLKLLVALVWSTPVLLPLLPAPRRVMDAPAIVARHHSSLGNSALARLSGPARQASNPTPEGDRGETALPPRHPGPAPSTAGARLHGGTRSAPAGAGMALLLLWLAGAGLSARKIVREWRASRRLAADAVPVAHEGLLLEYAALCRRLGLRRAPRLLLSAAAGSPVLAGTRPPAIVLPPALLAEGSAEEMRAIMAHELAHLRRWDLLWSWLPALAQVIFFFHPLVWLTQREWRLAQEIACDELAMQMAQLRPPAYGQAILKVAAGGRFPRSGEPAVVGAAGSYESLSRRLVALCSPRPMSRGQWRRVCALLAAGGVIEIVPWRVTARAVPSAPLRYEATVELWDGAHEVAHLLCDAGRFRVEHFRRPGDRTPEWVELYDGNDAGLVWAYVPKTHSAGPTLPSNLRAFTREASRLGADRARALYAVSEGGILPPRQGRPAPLLGGLTLADLDALSLQPAGPERPGNKACEEYQAEFVPARHDWFLRACSLVQVNPSHEWRVWVDPRTHLVLRLEHVMSYARTLRIPSRRQEYCLRDLRLLDEVPASQFQLPPETAVHVPRLFRAASLPDGVQRDAMAAGLAWMSTSSLEETSLRLARSHSPFWAPSWLPFDSPQWISPAEWQEQHPPGRGTAAHRRRQGPPSTEPRPVSGKMVTWDRFFFNPRREWLARQQPHPAGQRRLPAGAVLARVHGSGGRSMVRPGTGV